MNNRKQPGKNTIVRVIYSHQGLSYATFSDKFGKMIQKLSHSNSPFLLIGDYNIDVSKQNARAERYLNDVYSAYCSSLINIPTLITPTSSTILDHVYTGVIDKSCSSGVLNYDISDHQPTFCILQSNFDQPSPME